MPIEPARHHQIEGVFVLRNGYIATVFRIEQAPRCIDLGLAQALGHRLVFVKVLVNQLTVKIVRCVLGKCSHQAYETFQVQCELLYALLRQEVLAQLYILLAWFHTEQIDERAFEFGFCH